MTVVDASVAVKWFVAEPGREVAMRLISSGETLTAPDLVVVEVMNVLRRKHRQRAISERQLIEAASAIPMCFGNLLPAALLIEDAVRLSVELDHSVYDCVYLACAVALETILVTADKAFASKVVLAGHSHRIADFAGL